jgi:hypothetical protein
MNLKKYSNPFSDQLEALHVELSNNEKTKTGINDKIQWYERNSFSDFDKRITRLIDEIEELQVNTNNLKAELEIKEIEKISILEKQKAKLNPARYLLKSQRIIKQNLHEINYLLRNLKLEIEVTPNKINQIYKKIGELQSQKTQFANLDINQLKLDLKATTENCSSLLGHFTVFKRKDDRFRGYVQPKIDDLKKYSLNLNAAQSELDLAIQLDAELSIAPSGEARGLIHRKSRRIFGNDYPNKIIEPKRVEIESFKRSVEKLQRELKLAFKNVTKKVDLLIIDGNNLCYYKDEFIHFKVLDKIIDYLNNSFPIEIVFDPGIMGLTSKNEDQILEHFSKYNNLEVLIMPYGTTADTVILQKAFLDKRSYILSNDNFVEYPERKALINERVFKVIITNSTIHINDLDAVLKY